MQADVRGAPSIDTELGSPSRDPLLPTLKMPAAPVVMLDYAATPVPSLAGQGSSASAGALPAAELPAPPMSPGIAAAPSEAPPGLFDGTPMVAGTLSAQARSGSGARSGPEDRPPDDMSDSAPPPRAPAAPGAPLTTRFAEQSPGLVIDTHPGTAAADPPAPIAAQVRHGDANAAIDVATDRLGSVRVELDARDARLGVRLTVDREPAATMLGAHAARLEATLAAGGTRLEALAVDVRGGDQRGTASRGQPDDRRPGGSAPQARAAFTPSPVTPSRAATRHRYA